MNDTGMNDTGMNDTGTAQALPTWDLEPLLAGRHVDDLLADAADAVSRLELLRGRVWTLDADALAAAMRDYERYGDLVGRVSAYSTLRHWLDTTDRDASALMQHVDETSAELEARLTFFELEWAAIHDAHAEELLDDERLAFCRHHLAGLRAYGPYQLDEQAEKVDTARSVSGITAWRRLFGELAAQIVCPFAPPGETPRDVPLEDALAQLASPWRAVREAAHNAVSAALTPGLDLRAYVYNMVLLDRETTDTLRGFPSWVSEWNLENDTSDDQVRAMLATVRAHYGVARDWYRLKGEILGRPLDDVDRYASLASDSPPVSFDDAFRLVLDAFRALSPQWAEIAAEFADRRWIDAAPRPGRTPGAFCDFTVASANPYVLVSWTGTLSDVITLAHELGHGVHGYLARTQGYFHQETPLTVAETASVFAEMAVTGHLLRQATSPQQQLELLAGQMDDMVNTVFRQAALFEFEERAHLLRREAGELSAGELGELWLGTQRDLFGDSVRLGEAFSSWWSYIPHFFDAPGYVYAYPFGQLLALCAYDRYLEQGDGFVAQLTSLLAAGATCSPHQFAAAVGIDLDDPDAWAGGIRMIERQLQLTRVVAAACGYLPGVPA